jgi:hypothetical protein
MGDANDTKEVTAAREKPLVGHKVASLLASVRAGSTTSPIGSPNESAAETELGLKSCAIGDRLPANLEYSLITNYVSTRAERCKGVIGVNRVNTKNEGNLNIGGHGGAESTGAAGVTMDAFLTG